MIIVFINTVKMTLLKSIIYSAGLLVLFSFSFKVYAQQTAKRDVNGIGYLEYLPPGYEDNTDLYPVIIFLHGSGERGDGSPGALEKVKGNGPPRHINQGHTMCFDINGEEECFIVLSPQTNRWAFPGYEFIPFVDNAIANYRIDPNRVYLTGLSMGGQGTWEVTYSDQNVPNRFAALAPIAGRGNFQKACTIAENGTPVWGFHGDSDNAISLYSGQRPINGMLACDPEPVPLFTIYENVGHSGTWTRAYRTDNSLHTPNLYQWFLAQRMGEQPLKAPTVNAGIDLSITLPENNVEVSAIADDEDGELVSIEWVRISGPNSPAESDLNQLDLTLSNLVEGSYNYRITVTDNDGLSASDQVIITVIPEPINLPPTVTAGNNRVITLPTSFLTLNGTATDADGTIESTLWEQISGPNTASIASSNSTSSIISDLIEGNYVFSLSATDNDGSSVSDNVNVTVLPEPPNSPPTANAGNNLELTLPANVIVITGSGVDSDGEVVAYTWEQSSGPSIATISNINTAEITLSNFIQGAYVFVLTVTDDDGDTDSDQVTVNVLPAPPNEPPTANAGNDITITLPTNSVNLEGSGYDSDGTIETYLWEQENGPSTANISSSENENTEITSLIEGVYTFSFTVTDNEGDSNADNVQVNVLPAAPNSPPSVNAGVDKNLTLPTNYTTMTATATDEDGTIVSYLWVQIAGPNTATSNTLNNEAANISNLVEGIYQFTVTATDDDGATSSDQVNVTVFPEQNDAPDANAGNDITITLPTNTATLLGSGSDSDGTVENYSWTQVTGPNEATFENADQASASVEGLIEGVYRFRLTVTDNDGANDSDQINVNVLPEPANLPPTADAGDDVFLTLPENSTILMGQGADPDGTIISYTWNVIDAGDGNIDGIDNFEVQNLEISGLEAGIYTFGLTVVDNRGASSSDQVRVFVDTPNLSPNANAGNDITLTLPQNSVNFSGSANDPDGEVVFTLWEQVSGPNTANIANALSLTTSITGLTEGIYIFNLYVEDNDGLNDSDEMRITVNPAPPNIPPTANAGNDIEVTLPVDQIQLNGSAIDSDGSISSLTWTQLSGPNALTGTNLTLTNPIFTGFTEGVYTLRLLVTDNDGAQGSDDIRINVKVAPGNQLPTVDAGMNISMALPTNSTQLNGNAFDVDGTIESYSWTQSSGPNDAAIINPNQNTTALENLVQGIYTFRLTVLDNQSGEAFDQVNVRVNPMPFNQPPTVIASNNQVINLPQTSTSLTANANDVDGTIENTQWTQRSGPSPATLVNATSLNLGLENLILGTYIFRITVIDNSGVQSFDEVNVRVLEELSNQPPSVDAGTNQLIFLPDNTVTLSGSAQDQDGSIFSNGWVQVSGPAVANIVNAENYETEVNTLSEGTYIFRLEVEDNEGLSGFDQVSVRVNAELPNLPPNSNAGENVLLVLPSNQTTLTGVANDPDGTIQDVVWTQEFGPNSASLTGINQLNLQVSDLINGFYVFRLSVTDNEGDSDYDEVSVTVNEILPKQPPTVNAGTDQNIIIPESNIQLSGTATSGDGAISSTIWEQLSGPTVVNIENENELSTLVSNLSIGTYVFRLVVSNTENLQNFDLIAINVRANQAPFAFAGSDTTLTLPVIEFEAVGHGTDNDGSIVSVQWNQMEGPSTASIVNPASNQTVLGDFEVGNYQFEFRVIDDKGAESFDILRIEVIAEEENSAPNVNVGDDITITLPENSVSLEASGTDSDGSIVVYLWEQVSGPNTASVESPSEESTEVTGLEEGSYIFSFTVTDDDGASNSDQMNVTVLPEATNISPTAEAGDDITIQLPVDSVELNGTAMDPDGTIVQYQWELIEGGKYSIVTPDMPSTIVGNLELGNYIFQLTATDDGGLVVTDRLNVFVTAPDEPPFAMAELTKLFTPNGDGINDLWRSDALDQFSDCAVIIYNKLGLKVYEESNYQNNWDGKDQAGRIVEEGAYFYVISCENNFVKRGGVRIKK